MSSDIAGDISVYTFEHSANYGSQKFVLTAVTSIK